MAKTIHSINRISLIIAWLYFRKVIATMDHDLNLEEMLDGGSMDMFEYAEEENMEEVCLDDREEVEVEEGESEEEEDSDGQQEEGPEVIAKKKKLTAAVWFTAAKKLDSGKALCLVCKLVFSLGDGSPSNVRKHVIKRHSGSPEHKKMIEMERKQKEEKKKKRDDKPKVSIKDFFVGKKAISKKEAQKISSELEDFLVGTNTSLSMVENPFFRKMLFSLNSG